uniref:Uncharacterized protein n=1 Tax=Sander lucioperca TaxID=283035 RepID=A0A8D0D9M8_SANLU
ITSHCLKIAILVYFNIYMLSVCCSGESFDRQASFRKVVSNTDSLSRQTRNLSRCKTLAGLPDDVSGKLGINATHLLPKYRQSPAPSCV